MSKINQNFRLYGIPPYNIVVIHGGPGAAGEMKPVAIELSKKYGVIEPFQTKDTISKQVEELKNVIEQQANPPVVLIGWSWGAWLSFIFTSRYPELVKKLFLISSGPFEEKYAEKIMQTRLNRMNLDDKKMFKILMKEMEFSLKNKNKIFLEIGQLIDKADTFSQFSHKPIEVNFNYEIYEKIWREASDMRKSGELLDLGKNIKCPVIGIHGDFDPHPFQGVQLPLKKVINNFKIYLLKECGHHPWYEKEAKDQFYKILLHELSDLA